MYDISFELGPISNAQTRWPNSFLTCVRSSTFEALKHLLCVRRKRKSLPSPLVNRYKPLWLSPLEQRKWTNLLTDGVRGAWMGVGGWGFCYPLRKNASFNNMCPFLDNLPPLIEKVFDFKFSEKVNKIKKVMWFSLFYFKNHKVHWFSFFSITFGIPFSKNTFIYVSIQLRQRVGGLMYEACKITLKNGLWKGICHAVGICIIRKSTMFFGFTTEKIFSFWFYVGFIEGSFVEGNLTSHKLTYCSAK